MAEILEVGKILKLKKAGETLVLVGGCFDVLHPGHIIFLEKAKAAGDILVVLLESDQKVKKLKGTTRPVHTQKERARVLSALRTVDFVIMLPFMDSDESYGQLIQEIQPDIIAVTEGYKNTHQQRIAEITGAKLKYVTKKIGDHSTSKILNH